MSFWSVTGREPKRTYRWKVIFNGSGGTAGSLQNIAFALKKCDKPKAKIGSATHTYLNHKFHYPGRLEWEDLTMTFASISDPDATNYLYDIIRAAGYGVPSAAPGTNGDRNASTIGKNKFKGALGNTITLQQIDADGYATEEWSITNPFFTSVNFGTLDYATEEIVEIACTIKYDWAKLSTPASPGGQEPLIGNTPVS